MGSRSSAEGSDTFTQGRICKMQLYDYAQVCHHLHPNLSIAFFSSPPLPIYTLYTFYTATHLSTLYTFLHVLHGSNSPTLLHIRRSIRPRRERLPMTWLALWPRRTSWRGESKANQRSASTITKPSALARGLAAASQFASLTQT